MRWIHLQKLNSSVKLINTRVKQLLITMITNFACTAWLVESKSDANKHARNATKSYQLVPGRTLHTTTPKHQQPFTYIRWGRINKRSMRRSCGSMQSKYCRTIVRQLIWINNHHQRHSHATATAAQPGRQGVRSMLSQCRSHITWHVPARLPRSPPAGSCWERGLPRPGYCATSTSCATCQLPAQATSNDM